jgi:predicted hydrocarbon binding protein
MSQAVELGGDTLAIGRGALRALRQALQQDLGEQGAARLQEAGHAAGSDVYGCFLRWLKTETGVTDPGALDATKFGSVLGDFFQALGWGRIAVSRVGSGGLAFDAEQWAEAEVDAGATSPSCHFSAGLLAGFMGAMVQQPVSVMEVECRSANQARCRFLLGTPETLEAAYQAASEGRDYGTAI